MIGSSSFAIFPMLAQSMASIVPPVMILVLCVVAGIGTLLLLPSRREATLRKIGGVILTAAGLIFLAMLPKLAVGGAHAGSAVYFWIFSTIAIVGAIRVVTHPRPVYSALYFVLTVFASAGLFVLLEAEFLAAALILIYAGAILITYLFVIMLASAPGTETPAPARRMVEYDQVSREPIAAAAIGFALMGVLLFVIFDKVQAIIPPVGVAPMADGTVQPAIPGITGATQQLGLYLFRNQLVQLELAGLILTLAMVGAMIISRRQILVTAPQAVPRPSQPDVLIGPSTPVDDNPHSIPVYGTDNPRQKAYPQT